LKRPDLGFKFNFSVEKRKKTECLVQINFQLIVFLQGSSVEVEIPTIVKDDGYTTLVSGV